MTVETRRRRGRESEHAVADFLRRNGFPYAQPVGAGAPGCDITGTPGLAVEVKARRRLDIRASLRQSRRNSGHLLPIVVARLDGQGPADVGEWPVILTMRDFLSLWSDGE